MDRLPEELLDMIFTYLDNDVINLLHVGQAHNRFDATACRLLDRINISGMEPETNRSIIIENNNCSPQVKDSLNRFTFLEDCTLTGVVSDAGGDSKDPVGRWLQKLPKSIKTLVISGLEISPMNLQHLSNLEQLSIHDCSGVTDDWLQKLPNSTITRDHLPNFQQLSIQQHLPNLKLLSIHVCWGWRNLKVITIRGCSGVTDEDDWRPQKLLPKSINTLDIIKLEVVVTTDCLERYVGNLVKLVNLTLQAGVITGEVLDNLHSCSELWELQLGDYRKRLETDIPADAFRRLAVACKHLYWIYLHTTVDNSQAVLKALAAAVYPGNSESHTITLFVPGSVYSQLSEPPSGKLIRLRKWMASQRLSDGWRAIA